MGACELIRILVLLALLVIPTQSAWCAQGGHASSDGAFAFADLTGTRVLALSRVPNPGSIRVLLAAGGRQFPVEYVGLQEPSGEGTGRDVAQNFADCGGDVFRLVGARIWPDETCFLATDSLLALGQPVPLSREHKVIAAGPNDAVVLSKGRDLKSAWSLATFSNWGAVWLYEFEPQRDSLLATLAVWSDGRSATHDYPAKLIDPSSAWRIDDMGEFCSECFTILFVIRTGSGYCVGVSWAGAEGESLQLLSSHGTKQLLEVMTAYRYWAPS